MKNGKVIAITIISVLLLIICLQNAQAVQTRLLFMTITMSKALLLLVTSLMGFVAGLIAASYISRKPPESQGKGSPAGGQG